VNWYTPDDLAQPIENLQHPLDFLAIGFEPNDPLFLDPELRIKGPGAHPAAGFPLRDEQSREVIRSGGRVVPRRHAPYETEVGRQNTVRVPGLVGSWAPRLVPTQT